MQKYIFLDFDGVLNSHQHVLEILESEALRGEKGPRGVNPGEAADPIFEADVRAIVYNLDPRNLWNLKFLLKSVPDLRIVLSTTWRLRHSMGVLKEALRRCGIHPDCVVGKTPKKMSSSRADEIGLYLADELGVRRGNKNDVMWRTLDDKNIFLLNDPFKENEHKTDQLVGLTYRDALDLIYYFNPEFKQPVILM